MHLFLLHTRTLHECVRMRRIHKPTNAIALNSTRKIIRKTYRRKWSFEITRIINLKGQPERQFYFKL